MPGGALVMLLIYNEPGELVLEVYVSTSYTFSSVSFIFVHLIGFISDALVKSMGPLYAFT